MLGASAFLLLPTIFDAQMVRWVVWGGLVMLTLTLLVLMSTRWGHSNPLRKCVVLSLVAHLLLGIYTTTVNIVKGGPGPGGGGPLHVALLGPTDENEPIDETDSWNTPVEPTENLANQLEVEPDVQSLAALPVPLDNNLEREADTLPSLPAGVSTAPSVEEPAQSPSTKPAEPIEAPVATRTVSMPVATPEPPRLADVASSEPAPQRTVQTDPQAEALSPLAPPLGEASRSMGSAVSPSSIAPPAAIGTSDAELAGDPAFSQSGPSRLVPTEIPATTGAAPPALVPVSPELIARGGATSGSIGGAATVRPTETDAQQAPSIYELRTAPDRMRQAIGHGGSRDTEAAVAAALRWLAAHQSADGRWDGRKLEGGREADVDGQKRGGAGSRADTGITGLVLLSFLASGQTHLKGEHSQTVRRGLEFLLVSQATDGNLAGEATLYEKMYCHAMASFALSESFAMTQDDRLRPAVRRAVAYTLAAQHSLGGWRYRPGEAGDMSQLGWQFMALKSAEIGGLPIPSDAREKMIYFIKSVSSGKHGGLASYRPGHRVSRTMTAEALVCRQFLGMPRSNPASQVAGDFLMEELPGQGPANFYYWYYATLGLYQLQGPHWERWNEALQQTLIGTQRSDGQVAGSWDPDPLWGAYGGRAYSTALGALCLEVYYRYLPFHIEAAGLDREATRQDHRQK